MLALGLKLLLAHLIGDFVFQPDKWVKHKQKHKHKSSKLYLHIAVHAVALLVLLQFDFTYWLGMCISLISHLLIDIAKIYAPKKMNAAWLFVLDQALHGLIIVCVVQLYFPFHWSVDFVNEPAFLTFLVAILIITSVASILLRFLMSNWKSQEESDGSLKNAGSYIGMLERLFIFGFVVIDYWEGIGFLLAAKSVFRFGDLTNAKDRKLTEYILIGTLLSFGIAILFASVYMVARDYIHAQ